MKVGSLVQWSTPPNSCLGNRRQDKRVQTVTLVRHVLVDFQPHCGTLGDGFIQES